MVSLIERYGNWAAAGIVLLAAILVWQTFPDPADYHVGADEGTYYRQGMALVDQGVEPGFRRIAQDYLHTPEQQLFPNPLRIGTILPAALSLRIDPAYRSLSFLSLIAFVVLLAGVWQFAAMRFGRVPALAMLLLLAVSPLALALARRALMDSLAYAAAVCSLLAFFRLIENRGRFLLSGFIVSMTLAILVKETAVLLCPFYAAVLLYMKLTKEVQLTWTQLAAAIVLPSALTVLGYFSAYGIDSAVAIMRLVPHVVSANIEYTANFMQGPWHRYLLDFLLLEPWVFLLALGYGGYMLAVRTDRRAWILLALAGYLLFAYSFMPKDARYLPLLDLVQRIFAIALLFQLPQMFRGRFDSTRGWPSLHIAASWLPMAAIGLLVAADLHAFRRYFVVGQIYDPVTDNLLRVDHIIPDSPSSSSPPARSSIALETAKQRWLEQPTAGNARQLSYEYCAGGAYLECRWASQEALKIAPGDAGAYNNLCTAFGGLRQWTQAVAACREAMRLKPDFQLARNNLEWALHEEAKK